jgi:predicted AlkP superfamily phosphohydrolase/phosphomutase
MRVLLLGLDGLDHALVNGLVDAGEMPTVARLSGDGVRRELVSPPPTATIPAWTSILTGVNPGRHGLFDFTRREGYAIRFGPGRREAPNVFETLSALERRVVAVGFPGTFPAVRVRGAMLAGWDSPAAIHGRREGCHPPGLHDELVRTFGEDYLPFDTLDQFRAGTSAGPAWYRQAASRLRESIGRRIELALHVAEGLPGGPPDLLAVHFPEADTAGHHFWHLHDLNSPRRPGWIDGFLDEATGRVSDPLARVYAALDAAVAEMVDRFGPDVVVVVSDHGMGGSGLRLASINRLLAMEGLLHVQRGAGEALGGALDRLKRVGLGVLPPEVREHVVGGAGRRLAGTMAARIRFGGIDWSRTAAFSEDLNYAPSVYLNQVGREPRGIVREGDRRWWLGLVTDALEGWEAVSPPGEIPPGTRRVVESVHPREELFSGPHVDRLPDLVVRLASDGGDSYSLAPGMFRLMDSAVEPLPAHLLQGSKGRSMPGSHRPGGVFAAAPTSGAAAGCDMTVLEDVRQTSVAPLLLELMGFRAPGWYDSDPARVTDGDLEWVDERFIVEAFERSRSPAPPPDGDDERAVEKRLEDLGYL